VFRWTVNSDRYFSKDANDPTGNANYPGAEKGPVFHTWD
jgi:hypothetical protein